MKSQQVLDYLNRKPFRPFTINLDDGEAILIDAPRALLTSDRKPELLIAFTEDGRMHLFEESVISSLEELKTGEPTNEWKTILKTPPPGYDRTIELAFIFDPASTYANPYVLCQKWASNGSFEWVQVPVVSVIGP